MLKIGLLKRRKWSWLLAFVVVFSCAAQVWAAEAPDGAEQAEQSVMEEVIVKQVFGGVDKTAEHYLLVVEQNGAELRLNFAGEVENAALLVDAQTGFQTDWVNVQPGIRVMVNYSRQPQGAQLHYLLLNLDDESPKGLFTIEEMAGFAYNRMLVDNGRLWLIRADGDLQLPDNFDEVYLGVGRRILVWYDEAVDGRAVCTRLRPVYSQQEVQEHRQAKARRDMYYNKGRTQHLLVSGVSLPNSVRYVHGEPYLPLRQTAELLGFSVEWDAAAQAAVLRQGDFVARVVPYEGVFWQEDGQEQSYYSLPREYECGICVSARLFERFGADISVEGQTMIIK